jgi:hypothetical protein
MRIISRALETGTIEAALVTGNFTSQFRRAGYHILGELDRVPMMGNAVVVKQSFLQNQRNLLRSFLRAISEAQVFVLSPIKKQSVLRVLTKRLSISDRAVAEDALQDLVKRLDKKPLPSIPEPLPSLIQAAPPRSAPRRAASILKFSPLHTDTCSTISSSGRTLKTPRICAANASALPA